jgi:hypothetical protein
MESRMEGIFFLRRTCWILFLIMHRTCHFSR